MGLKKFVSASILSLSLVFTSYASDVPSKEKVEKALRSIMPRGEVVEVSKTPIPNIYEVVINANGRYIPIYIDKSLNYVISGMIVDLKKRENITQKRFLKLQQEIEKKKILELAKLIGEKKAEKLWKILANRKFNIVNLPPLPKNVVVEGNPNGKKVIYVITDPECPFCKRFNDELKKLIATDSDIKIVEIFYPLPFHRNAYQISSAVLCQTDNTKAKEMLNKAFDNQGNSSVISSITRQACEKGNQIIKKHKGYAFKVGLTGTPTIVIPLKNNKGIVISGGFSAEKLKEILNIIYGK